MKTLLPGRDLADLVTYFSEGRETFFLYLNRSGIFETVVNPVSVAGKIAQLSLALSQRRLATAGIGGAQNQRALLALLSQLHQFTSDGECRTDNRLGSVRQRRNERQRKRNVAVPAPRSCITTNEVAKESRVS